MSKLFKSLLVVAAIASATAVQAETYRDVEPAIGLPICSAAYGALSHYSETRENKEYWMKESWRVAKASKRYNSAGPDDAIVLAKEMVGRINSNEPGYFNTFKTTVNNCHKYIKMYGL